MKILKCFLSIILAFAMVISPLIGCARDDGDADNIAAPGFTTPEYIYQPEVFPFPELRKGMENIGIVALTDDKVYFTAWSYMAQDVHVEAHGLFCVDFDGTGLEELPGYDASVLIPGGKSGYVSINAMFIDSEGYIWVAESGGSLAPDPDNSESFNVVRKLDNTGAQVLSFDISGIYTGVEWFFVTSLMVDNAGYIYLTSGSNIFVLSSHDSSLFTLDNPDLFEHLVSLSDGIVALTARQMSGVFLKIIDAERKSWGETIKIPAEGSNEIRLFPGSDEYLYLFSDNSNLYGVIKETGEAIGILNWADSTTSPDNIADLLLLPDGRILATGQSMSSAVAAGREITGLIIFTRISYDELPERKTLTLGTFFYDVNTRYVVELFNRESKTHRIQVLDYSQYNTSDDYSAGYLKLAIEIIAGSAPDIINVQHLSLQTFISKGLLIDLYPLLDLDLELSREDFFENILKASETDGSLYSIPTSFGIGTIFGSPALLGDYPGWTMDEFLAVLENNPQADIPLGWYVYDTWLLWLAVRNRIDEFVDYTSGNVDFDNEEFVGLLELAKLFPSETDIDFSAPVYSIYEPVIEERIIMFPMNFAYFNTFRLYRTMFGGELVFKGYPDKNRDGNAIVPYDIFTISSNCKDISAAWEFVRIFLTEEYQRDILQNSFPINVAAFEANLLKETIPTVPAEGYYVGDIEVIVDELSEQEAEQILNLVKSTTRIGIYDEALFTIITESAQDFFTGKITAQDAARIIQSRASIYIAEQS